jgi:GTP-binding protein Era
MSDQARRCGFVAVLGAPNAGKSTLVNRAVGQKVSIVSPKVQTTRSRVLGIVTEGATQLVLIDTPGIFAPRRRLDRAMVAAAWGGAADADAVVLIVDAARKSVDDETRNIIAGLNAARQFVERHWSELVAADSEPPQDAKTALQEWAQAAGLALPLYTVVKSEGPPHDPVFEVEVTVAGY